MAGARKLIVEVTSAKDLMPKDGQGSSNAYCVLDYDGQRKRTKVKPKDLDPTWNEKSRDTIGLQQLVNSFLNIIAGILSTGLVFLHHRRLSYAPRFLASIKGNLMRWATDASLPGQCNFVLASRSKIGGLQAVQACATSLPNYHISQVTSPLYVSSAYWHMFEFMICDPVLPGDLEINVQNERNSGTGRRSSFLGRVVVPVSTVPSKPETVRWYPLQKRGLFSHIKGDLGLKIWCAVEQPPKPKEDKKVDKREKEGGKEEGGGGGGGGKLEKEVVGGGAIGGGGGGPGGPGGIGGIGGIGGVVVDGVGGGEKPRFIVIEGKPKEGRKEAKADKMPEPSRPNRITVPEADFTVKETNPDLGKAVDYKQHYDLVEQMSYLFVRVVRARGLLGKDENGSSDPYVRLTVGAVKTESKIIKHDLNPEWNQVFAVGKDKIQGGTLELSVWDADKISKDDFLGGFMFDLNEVPSRKPPESPLAPQWYKLEEKNGKGRVRGEIMVAIWWGTQADEAFPEAWQSDTGGHAHFRAKVYLSPKLWYLRVNVIEAQDLIANDKGRLPEPYVRAHAGPYQTLRTRPASVRSASPFWNEDLMFVAAEPFDDFLHLLVEDRIGPKEEILGQVRIPLSTIERRIDGRPVASRWYILEKEAGKGGGFLGRIHLRLCFDGGYHVMDESSNYTSCTRPTAKQLWRPSLGVLELGIHGANNLLPMKTTKDNRGSTDGYCVAKYGQKWIRTRTIFESFNPRWNEQYTWEVYDPCTVLTVGVFDNRHTQNLIGDKAAGLKDLPIGKVRIRLSTLESDRVYTNAYPLLVVTPQGVKKMGELELAVRLSCASTANLMQAYLQPQLPRMHYFYPLDPKQLESLRVAAMNIVALRLMRAEPPLRQEVVQFMLDTEAERWSMRRSKANYYRIMGVLNGVLAVMNWFSDICSWKSPVTTVLVHILFLILVWYPELLLPTVFLYMFLIGAWNYRFRSRTPPFMDAKLSQGEHIGDLDELEEEFNVIPANRAQEVLKHRYERLRGVSGRIQNALGNLASMGERLHSLLSWRDPRATSIFITFCLVAAIVLYVTPFQVVAVLLGVYTLRHPRFRDPLPAVPMNFFARLPSQSDRIL